MNHLVDKEKDRMNAIDKFDEFIKANLSELIEEQQFVLIKETSYPRDVIIRGYASPRLYMSLSWDDGCALVCFRPLNPSDETEYWGIVTVRNMLTNEPILYRALAIDSLNTMPYFWYDAGHLQFLRENIDAINELFDPQYFPQILESLRAREKSINESSYNFSIPYAPPEAVRPRWADPRQQ